MTLNDKIKYEFPLEFIEALEAIGYELPDFTVERIQKMGYDDYAEVCSIRLEDDIYKNMEFRATIKERMQDNRKGVQEVLQKLSNINQHMAYATARIEATIHSVDYTDEEMYQDECDLMMDQDTMDIWHSDVAKSYPQNEPHHHRSICLFV